MAEEISVSIDPKDVPKLKHPEADVSPDEPWQDDVLDRAKIAEKLSKIIRDQRDPFVIGIDGQWGTGKTFLLKRWQRDLEREGASAIYFNAWEDDFCDDPLLAIIGQLSDHFKKGNLETLADELGKIAIPLLKKNALSVLSRATGLSFEVDLNERDLLKEYREQRQTKTELISHLTKISAAVVQETDLPLIFIIDELDRCRPTFAIELLERVKHVFDVPDVVFVFGINRDELCKSLESIYGEIDGTVYLRRFFDMEFSLPNANSEKFCESLMKKYRFREFFQSLSQTSSTRIHRENYDCIATGIPALCGQLGLSLRDIDYCLRVIALAARSIQEKQHIFPWLLSLLVLLKFENPVLYRKFIDGECHASDVMNHLDSVISFPSDDHRLNRAWDAMEAELYLAENSPEYDAREATVWHQLTLLQNGAELTHPDLLSERTKKSSLERIARVMSLMGAERYIYTPRNLRAYLASLINLHDFIRR
ncbi:MAG: P-loop NTPase fold protein [Caldilineaceae bacterium]|nr:P-loop NTPase fold protein [Caldilineaceae bacterium]